MTTTTQPETGDRYKWVALAGLNTLRGRARHQPARAPAGADGCAGVTAAGKPADHHRPGVLSAPHRRTLRRRAHRGLHRVRDSGRGGRLRITDARRPSPAGGTGRRSAHLLVELTSTSAPVGDA